MMTITMTKWRSSNRSSELFYINSTHFFFSFLDFWKENSLINIRFMFAVITIPVLRKTVLLTTFLKILDSVSCDEDIACLGMR